MKVAASWHSMLLGLKAFQNLNKSRASLEQFFTSVAPPNAIAASFISFIKNKQKMCILIIEMCTPFCAQDLH